MLRNNCAKRDTKITDSQAAMAQSVEHAIAPRKIPCSSLGHSCLSLVENKEFVRVVSGSEKTESLRRTFACASIITVV